MRKQCAHCNKSFIVSLYRKKYCSILCAKNAHDLQKSQYKQRNKHKIELKELNRKRAIIKTLRKNASNLGKPYSEDDDKLIMSRIDNKFEYTPTMLAYMLKRTKGSIEQRRNRLKKIEEGKIVANYKYSVLVEESCSAIIQYDLIIKANSIGHAKQMVQDAFDHNEDIYNLGEVVKETIIDTSESDPIDMSNVTDIRYYNTNSKDETIKDNKNDEEKKNT